MTLRSRQTVGETPVAAAKARVGAKVETLDVPDSAALGGAILAAWLLG